MTPQDKPETEIPADLQQWMLDKADNTFTEGDWHDTFIIGMQAMYRKLQADKPTALPWIEINPPGSEKSNLPEIDEFVLWRTKSGGYFICEIDKDDVAWWNGETSNTSSKGTKCTHWARITGPDESTPDETATLRAQLAEEYKRGDELAEHWYNYMKALQDISDGTAKGLIYKRIMTNREMQNIASEVLKKYPQINWREHKALMNEMRKEIAELKSQLTAAQAERDLFLSTIRFLNRLQPSQVAQEVLAKYPPTQNT